MSKSGKKKSAGGLVLKTSEDIKTYEVVPSGSIARIRSFGAASPSVFVVLEWGQGSSWDVVHAIYGYASPIISGDYIGDGVKAFRVRRINATSSDQNSFFWLDWLEK